MGHVRQAVLVDAPVEVCWALGTDPARWPEYLEGAIGVRDTSGTAHEIGYTFTIPYRIAGRELEVRWTITRVDRSRSIELTGTTTRGGHALTTQRYEPVPGGTNVEVEVDYELPGGFAGDVADRLFIERAMDRQIRHSNENFKALAEAEAARTRRR
jgi:uncharacterized membrane protein